MSENGNDDLVSFLRDQIRDENVERRENGATVYRLSSRYLGIFTHCIIYEQDGEGVTLLEFKYAPDNYSRFIFFDEAGIMVDTVCEHFGMPPKKDYELARERIVAGDTGTAIYWP